jgi:hypothetical protein
MVLTELYYVSRSVGLAEARRMPTEVRRWWITRMQKDENPEGDVSPSGATRRRTVDV